MVPSANCMTEPLGPVVVSVTLAFPAGFPATFPAAVGHATGTR